VVIRPVERGERRESFPGPATLGGPSKGLSSFKNTEKGVSDGLFLISNMQKNSFSAETPPRTPLAEFTSPPQTPSRMVRGNPSLRFISLDAFGVSISAHTEWGCDRLIGPRDSGFPSPAVALDGPDGNATKLETAFHLSVRHKLCVIFSGDLCFGEQILVQVRRWETSVYTCSVYLWCRRRLCWFFWRTLLSNRLVRVISFHF